MKRISSILIDGQGSFIPPTSVVRGSGEDIVFEHQKVKKTALKFELLGRQNKSVDRKEIIVIKNFEKFERPGILKKLSYIIEELLTTEKAYVKALETGIATYLSLFSNENVPEKLFGKKYHVFGNIECIYKFHNFTFLPKLIECGFDVQNVGELFVKFIDDDSFYGYILYALYRNKSEKLCEEFMEYFMEKQIEVGDKLGVISFILQPIQRLPRYQLLLRDMLKVLLSASNNIIFKQEISTICKAEKRLSKFITTMNESITVNDIVECEKLQTIDLGLGVAMPKTNLEVQATEDPALFLFPKLNNDNCFVKNKPINLLHQGKFKQIFSTQMYDRKLNREYKGKIFIFERAVIYVESTSETLLEYRGHFCSIELAMEDAESLKLFSKYHREQEIKLKRNTITLPMADLIQNIIEASEKNKGQLSLSTCSSNSTRTSSSSDFSSDSCSTIPNNMPALQDIVRDEKFEEFLNYSISYLQSLNDNMFQYIQVLPQDVQILLQKFTESICEIMKLQQKINHRLATYQDFKFFDDDSFEIYYNFFTLSRYAEAKLKSFEQYKTYNYEFSSCVLSIENFLYLPLEYVNYCFNYFKTCTNLGDVEGKFEFLNQRLQENYHIRKLISDSKFIDEIGLVKYSEIVKLERSYAKYRMFLMQTGILCLRIKHQNGDEKKAEFYTKVIFYSPYLFSEVQIRRDKKQFLVTLADLTKVVVEFGSVEKRKLFCEKLASTSNQNKRRLSTFYVPL